VQREAKVARGFEARDRAVLRVGGPEARDFLQGLVSNDIRGIDRGAVYAAMLTPQGKYLFDFICLADGADVLIDVAEARAAALAQRLGMYRLRAKVAIAAADLRVAVLLDGPAPEGVLAVADPRDARLGLRVYAADPAAALAGAAPMDPAEWHALRVALAVPETGLELIPDETYILEAGFERLHGVDFRKGCYVGQEVTARMKHKTELRKGLVQVRVEGAAPPPGTEITAEGRSAGTLYSTAGGIGLAHLRFDRAQGALTAGAARISLPEAAS
jgi:folate-binding protein YgfZ